MMSSAARVYLKGALNSPFRLLITAYLLLVIAVPLVGQKIDSPAYQQYEELLKAKDGTILTGLYACFYDSPPREHNFFVFNASFYNTNKKKLHASVTPFRDGVLQEEGLLFFEGDLGPLSSKRGVFAELPTLVTYKLLEMSELHKTDVFKWTAGDVSMELGFGKLLPGVVRSASRFRMQGSTGRFVEDTIFDTGVEPRGFTSHETGKCIRIPNKSMTPEEQYNLAEDKQ